MKKRFLSILLLVSLCFPAVADQLKGTVYVDSNHNQIMDDGEQPLPGVKVSNGREIVFTDALGRYSIDVDDDTIVFVIKPRNYMTPVDHHNLPRFYYIHKPNGTPIETRFLGVAPTGPLPERFDFPLYPQSEPEEFKIILFGDTQPRDIREVDYIARDTIPELVGTDAAFGVTLGDIVFDDLSVFEPLIATVSLVGIPWYNVLGNHDINYEARNDKDSDETYERYFGPSYYSFDYGPVHFLVLDDIYWRVKGDGNMGYIGGLNEEQMTFIENDLRMIPEDQMVVLMMHIPLTHSWEDEHRSRLLRMMEKRPFCLSISAHEHVHSHHFLEEKDGWLAPEPHHHIVNATVCGSWFTGAPDERGIPHTVMKDGAPNGYGILHFDGNSYRHEYKASRKPAGYQMNIYAPEEIPADYAEVAVRANIFNGSERSVVEMRVGGSAWQPMEKVMELDPEVARINEEEKDKELPYRRLSGAALSRHMWKAALPAGLPAGTYLIEVRTKDMFGQTYLDSQPIRVAAD